MLLPQTDRDKASDMMDEELGMDAKTIFTAMRVEVKTQTGPGGQG